MKSSLITAAPVPLTLTLNGEEQEFRVVPFSDRDFDALDEWVQAQVVSVTRRSLRSELEDGEIDSTEYEREMQLAAKAAISVSIYEQSGMDVINTPKGAARLLWQMTRKEHPDLKPKDLVPYCRDRENYNEIIRAFGKLNVRDSDVKVKDPEGNE